MKNLEKCFSLTILVLAIFVACSSPTSGGNDGPILFTVTFDGNDATSGTVPAAMTQVSEGASITLPDMGSLVHSNFNFGGWNTSTNGSGTNYAVNSSYIPMSNITLYACWLPPVALLITSKDTTTVTYGTGGTFTVIASGTSPISYSLSEALDGVSIDSSSGIITIEATMVAGAYYFDITAENSTNSNTQNFILVVGKTVGGTVPISNGSISGTNITATAVTVSGNAEQTTEYAISTLNNTAPTGGWQEGTTFSSLTPGSAYYVWARAKESANYLAGTAVVSTVSIEVSKLSQAAFTFSSPTEVVTFGDIGLSYTATGGSGGGGISYAVTSGDVASVGTSTGTITILKAGTVIITATKAGDTTYNAVTTTLTLTINKAEISPSVSISPVITVPATPSPSYTGTNPGSGVVSYTYSTIENSGYSAVLPSTTGTYWVKATVAETSNYLGGTSTAVSFTISPAGTLSVTAWVANHQIATDAGSNTFTLSRSGSQSVTINVTDSGTYQWTVGTAVIGMGSSYTFSAAGKDSGRYNLGLQVTTGGILYATNFTVNVTN